MTIELYCLPLQVSVSIPSKKICYEKVAYHFRLSLQLQSFILFMFIVVDEALIQLKNLIIRLHYYNVYVKDISCNKF